MEKNHSTLSERCIEGCESDRPSRGLKDTVITLSHILPPTPGDIMKGSCGISSRRRRVQNRPHKVSIDGTAHASSRLLTTRMGYCVHKC